jgi:hypothetical protein
VGSLAWVQPVGARASVMDHGSINTRFPIFTPTVRYEIDGEGGYILLQLLSDSPLIIRVVSERSHGAKVPWHCFGWRRSRDSFDPTAHPTGQLNPLHAVARMQLFHEGGSVTSTPEIVEAAVKALDTRSRAELEKRPLNSLDQPSEAEIEDAWYEEAEQRRAEVLAGRAKTIPADEAIKRALSRLP